MEANYKGVVDAQYKQQSTCTSTVASTGPDILDTVSLSRNQCQKRQKPSNHEFSLDVDTDLSTGLCMDMDGSTTDAQG